MTAHRMIHASCSDSVQRTLARRPRPGAALALGGMLGLSTMARARGGEHRVDYRYEDYAEDDGRIHIRTHGAYFSTELKSWLSVKGNYIHDAISGATPTGAPPIPGESKVAKATIDDIRNAGFVEPTFRIRNHTIGVQAAYSRESDYESVGLSLNHAIELNDKNTTLSWGVSHALDRILPNPGAALSGVENKGTTDLLLGVTQLLGPATVATVNLTVGYSDGYLNDPYKRVVFDDFPYTPGQPYTVWPEERPGHKFRQVLFVSVQHFFDGVQGAVEADYRLHHDDFGILANTLTLQWHQKLGRRVVLSPLFRFHTQTEADFYATHFPGDPSIPESPLPDNYSSDYRLSAMNTYTVGLSVSARVHDHVSLELVYKRYLMFGTDGVTADDQYPQANVFTGGLTLWF